MRFRRVLTGAVLTTVAGAVVLAPPARAADPAPLAVTSLPNGFGAIEVDPASQRVFVSSPASSAVTALGFGGEILGTITVPGAGALLVDAGTLYVASTTAGRVDAFDAATLAPGASYGGGSLVKPNTLAKAGGRLWTTTGSCGSSPRLVSINPATSAVVTHATLSSLTYCPSLHASPTAPNLLVGFDTGISPASLVRLDVSGANPVVSASLSTSSSNAKDAEVLPDGSTVAFAAGSPYEIRTFGVEPLRSWGVSYPTGAYPVAVEATPAAGGLLAAGRDASYDDDVDVFRLGDPSARLFHHDFGSTSDTVKNRGLAFSPDGSRLFVVSGSLSGDTAKLNVFDLFDPRATKTTLSASPSYAGAGEQVTLTAQVTASGLEAVTGSVSFFRGTTLLGSAPVDESGQARFSPSVLAIGLHTFTARYGGSASSWSSEATTSMRVHAQDATNPVAVTALPDGFSSIEADAATGRIFVSSPLAGTVTVLDEDAQPVGHLSVPGAGAMVVDGPTLYVVSTTGGRVDAFDTTTLAPTTSFGGGSLVLRPDTIVRAGGRLWASTCESTPRLLSIDPATGSTTEHALPVGVSCQHLFTSPSAPNIVLGFNKGTSPATLVRFDVSSGTPVVSATFRTDVSNTKDGEVLPGGETLALASGSPGEIRTFQVNPLAAGGVTYPTGSYPTAVAATSAAGGLLAAGRDGIYDTDIDVFRLGDPASALLRHDFASTDDTVKDRGLAFSADGTKVFAVTGSRSADAVRLNVLKLPVAATSTALRATPNPAREGDLVTLTATVTSAAGDPVSGDVTFSEGAATLGTAAVDASGQATLVVGPLAAGTHTITARYNGAGTLPASSATTSLAVRGVTSLALATSASSSAWGQPVTLTATVTASSVPTGSVSFFDGDALLGTSPLDGSGAAGLTTTALEVGSHSLRATYAGTATFDPATSSVLAHSVQKASTTTSLTATASSVAKDTPVTFTAGVARASTGADIPTGSVTFWRGTTPLATVALQNGSASLTVVLAPGTYSITATYGGDAHFATSTSAARSLVVKKGKG